MSGSDRRIKEAVGLIEQVIAKSQDSYLPSVRALAKHFRKDICVISKALRILASQGSIELRKGSRTRIVGRAPRFLVPFPAPKETSSLWLYRTLREQIECGELRPGQTLPKQSYLCLKHGLSAHSVQKAYEMLVASEYAFSRGKSWIVGRSSPDRNASASTIPVILLLQRLATSWASLHTERTSRLMSSILGEIESSGVLVVSCVLHKPVDDYALPPSGVDEIEVLLKNLSSRFIGSILVGFSGYPDDLAMARAFLKPFARPAIYIDTSSKDILDKCRHIDSPHARTSESAAVKTALEFIGKMGHAVTGYLGCDDGEWEQRRGECLKRHASDQALSIRVIKYEEAFNDALRCTEEQILERLQKLARSASANGIALTKFFLSCVDTSFPVDKALAVLASQLALWPEQNVRNKGAKELPALLRQRAKPGIDVRLFHNMEVLLPFLLHDQVTCLIIPHDAGASFVYRTLVGIGLAIPDDISLISFDNYVQRAVLPVTTVEMGFDNLGYRVVHHLLRDLPGRSGPGDEIIGQPKIVRRGSVRRLF